jgi:3-oxoacyl-[acyl-carrier-protein] synthase-3
MRYEKVFLDSIAYELPPVVVTTRELEDRLLPLYEALHIAPGYVEALTGIVERRWWEEGFALTDGAIAAARKALAISAVHAEDLGAIIYAGVCREQLEPATACRVAAALGASPSAAVYDVSNACLGVLNGILDVANRIELGQIEAGLVVTCESAREITEITMQRMLAAKSMDVFVSSLATLTGGSGAAAVLLTSASERREVNGRQRHRLLGGVTGAAPERHGLCRWGFVPRENVFSQLMTTDSVNVLKYGVELGWRTWETFLRCLDWTREHVDKVICHQVGASHRASILERLGIPAERDYTTFEYLGNMGTASLPLTAALAESRKFLRPGDRVGLLGIGSGLNCLMLGVEW